MIVLDVRVLYYYFMKMCNNVDIPGRMIYRSVDGEDLLTRGNKGEVTRKDAESEGVTTNITASHLLRCKEFYVSIDEFSERSD